MARSRDILQAPVTLSEMRYGFDTILECSAGTGLLNSPRCFMEIAVTHDSQVTLIVLVAS